MRTNYILVDYENVQPAAMQLLHHAHIKVIVFVGASQARVSFEAAAALQRMGDRATWLKIHGSGPNALDFHIAFYIGQLSVSEPEAYFHVISKDTGFDPLIDHLKGRKILAARWKTLTDVPALQKANARTPDEQMVLVVANLEQRGDSRPRTLRTLSSTIHSLFDKALSAEHVADLVQRLQGAGVVLIDGQKVAYKFPSPPG